MRKSEVLGYSREYVKWFEEAYSVIKEKFNSNYVDDICNMRGYVGKEQRNKIESMQIGKCSILDTRILGEHRSELGLVTNTDSFLLEERYIIPVRDIAGNITALVGWFPDNKKYITTPSMFFSKDILLFNIDEAYRRSWNEYNGVVFLVEGMFDCISLSAIGLPVVATMGSTVSSAKAEQLKLFRKVIGIPDNDKVGRKALNRYDSRHGWKVPSTATMLRIKGGIVNINGTEFKVKDMDNFVSLFDADSVRETLLNFADCNDEIADLII